MRILLICNKPPYPPRDGGSLAMYNMITGLIRAGHKLRVLAVNAPKFGVKPEDIPEDFRRETGLEFIDTDLSVRPLPALWYLLSGQSYQVRRFYQKSFTPRLKEILKEGFDIVQFETVFPAVYLPVIRPNTHARIVLRAHNIEHQIWEQLAANSKGFFKEWYLRKVAESLKSFETDLFTEVDGIAAITGRDKAFVEWQSCKTPVINIPFGIDAEKYTIDDNAGGPLTLFHIAAMNWRPNEEGLRWLLGNVWPQVHNSRPELRLVLAGRKMPAWVNDYFSKGVSSEGEVPDSWEFIRGNGIMLVPLFSGSGVRIKIIEGMLAGKAVISTTKGACGIECTHNENIILADTPEAFTRAILYFADHPQRAAELGQKAREFILKHHNINTIIPELTEFYHYLSQ